MGCRRLPAWVVLVVAAGGLGCTQLGEQKLYDEAIVATTLPADVAQIFSTSCALSGCHAGDNPALGMSLEPDKALASLVGVAAAEAPGKVRVAPGDPDASFLLAKVRGQAPPTMPPPPKAPLTDVQIAALEAWIRTVAPPAGGADAGGVTDDVAEPPDGDSGGVSVVSDAVQAIFTRSCALSGCHGGAAPTFGLDLTAGKAIASLVDVPSLQNAALIRLVPGDPASSLLVAKLKPSPPVGTPMPPPAGGLSDADIKTIEDWVSTLQKQQPPVDADAVGGDAEVPEDAAGTPDGGAADTASACTPKNDKYTVSYGAVQAIVTGGACSGGSCHVGAASPAVGMDLSGNGLVDNAVGVPSVYEPDFLRIAPGDSAKSYLVIRLRGEQKVGSKMPLTNCCLSDTDIGKIAAWIDDCASKLAEEGVGTGK